MYIFYLFIFIFITDIYGYCPACERNNQFTSLMNSLRPPSTVIPQQNQNSNTNYWNTNTNNWNTQPTVPYPTPSPAQQQQSQQNSWLQTLLSSAPQPVQQPTQQHVQQPYQQQQNTFSSYPTSSQSTSQTPSYPTQQSSFQPTSNSFQNLPFRIINAGYGCCMNTVGPCCSNQQTQYVIPTFTPNNNNYGSFQHSESNPTVDTNQYSSYPSTYQSNDWPPVPQIQTNNLFPSQSTVTDGSPMVQSVDLTPQTFTYSFNPDTNIQYRNPYGSNTPTFQFE